MINPIQHRYNKVSNLLKVNIMKTMILIALSILINLSSLQWCIASKITESEFEQLPAPINVTASDFEPGAVYVYWEYPHDMTYIIFEVYRSTSAYGTYKKIGYCYETYWVDTEAWPTIKAPQNISASTTYSDGILLSWSSPVYQLKYYYYKIKAKEIGGQNRTSAFSVVASGKMLDYLDTQSARIFVADNALGPYTLLAENQPCPLSGVSTFWHTPLGIGTSKYYRMSVSTYITHKPSDLSSIASGSTVVPTLTGPTLVCSYNSTFYLNGAPSGSSVQWNTSANINIVDYSTISCTVTSNGNGIGWIQVTVEGLPAPLIKEAWVGAPITNYVSGPESGFTYNTYYFSVYPSYDGRSEATYYWYLSPLYDNQIFPYYDHADIAFYSSGSYQIAVNAINSCGSSEWATGYIDIEDNYYYTLSPNPANSEFTINVINDKDPGNIIYKVKIIDLQGTLRKQISRSGSAFTIPISDLPSGQYIVNINNNIRSTSLNLFVKH